MSTKNFPFGLNPNADTLVAPLTMMWLSAFRRSVNWLALVVTVADVEVGTRPLTCGDTNDPVLLHPHVGAGRFAGG